MQMSTSWWKNGHNDNSLSPMHSVRYLGIFGQFSLLISISRMLAEASAVLLSSVMVAASAAKCPNEPGWFQAGDSCYLVSLDKMPWFRSQEASDPAELLEA